MLFRSTHKDVGLFVTNVEVLQSQVILILLDLISYEY
jgi:hypothetical protein